MRRDWTVDVAAMHDKFGMSGKPREFDVGKLRAFLDFRVKFLREELAELSEAETACQFVDALIDLCVVAIGTLDLFDVDSHKAWDAVNRANMAKEAGSNPSRPNAFGLPDLVKPAGWVAPTHADNVGLLAKLFEKGVVS